jgi:hypothetical protein
MPRRTSKRLLIFAVSNVGGDRIMRPVGMRADKPGHAPGTDRHVGHLVLGQLARRWQSTGTEADKSLYDSQSRGLSGKDYQPYR